MNCKNCKHWSKCNIDLPDGKVVGRCSILDNNSFSYWENEDEASEKIEDGKIVCENLYVHENFGCIHFER